MSLQDRLSGRATDLAPLLLGAIVTHASEEGRVSVRLTEVEAYEGLDDPGSHAHRGRTARNAVMFGPAGRLYVYFTYGMHHCCNVVCGPDGTASALLLRAGEVIEGVELARRRRRRERDLASGPARLCQALGLDRGHDGARLDQGPLRLDLPERPSAARIRTGPRVGLRHAADAPWRFWLEAEPSVSTYRPAKRLG